MSLLVEFLDAQLVIGGVPILWREIIGNVFGLAAAIGGMRRMVWAWPVGIVGNLTLLTLPLAGIATAVYAWWFPLVLGNGRAAMQTAFLGIGLGLALATLVGKCLLTMLTLRAGAVGGTRPTLVAAPPGGRVGPGRPAALPPRSAQAPQREPS